MARRRLVTRTITATEATCLCMDVTTAEPMNETYRLVGKFTDDEKLLKAIRKLHETDVLKIVTIVDKKETNELYGLDENEYLAMAHIIARKAN